MTPEQMQAWTLQRELDERNRPMTDDEIEALLPTGYKVIYHLRFCNFLQAGVRTISYQLFSFFHSSFIILCSVLNTYK